ncbi:unnamed protein product [Symbiodinium natans]|uniref:PUB domain-containing protein n=1 Tax=Symbiodinium natans TaxID=878477 RepID=A0A812UZS2_9DINO|nr:unnamed protein product [Symbiodinium natans]
MGAIRILLPRPSPLSLRESFDAINSCLQRLVAESNSKAEAAKSLSTLAMVLRNLLNDPSSEKNRKVNTSSTRFSEIFRNNSAAAELLKLAGFQFQHPNFVFGDNGQSTEGAQRTLDLLQEAQRNLDQTWTSKPPGAPGTLAGSAPPGAPATPEEEARAPTGAAQAVTTAPAGPATTVPAPAASVAAARPWARASAAQQWASQARDIGSEEAGGLQAGLPSSGSAGSVPTDRPTPSPTPAHPAETLPSVPPPNPPIAHPAEASGPATAPAHHTGPQMHLPIAHPAQAAVVTAAHPAEGMTQPQPQQPQPQPAAHPAEAQAAHPAESQNLPAARPAETHAAHPAEVPQMAHPAESTLATHEAPADTGASEEPQSGG